MSQADAEIPVIGKSITKTLSDMQNKDLDTCSAALDDLVSFELEHRIPSGRIDETFSILMETSADDRKLIRHKSMKAISEITTRPTLAEDKVVELFDTLINKSSITMGMDEDVLTLLIQKAGGVNTNQTIQKYAMEGIKKFTETNDVSGPLADVILDFLVSITDATLQEIAIDGIIQLARYNKITVGKFYSVYQYLFSTADSTTASDAIRLRALDGLDAVLLREDPDASEILSKISEAEPEDANPIPLSTEEYTRDIAMLQTRINHMSTTATSAITATTTAGADHRNAYLKKYMDITAILVLLSEGLQARNARQSANNHAMVTPILSDDILSTVFDTCRNQYAAPGATEAVMQSSAIAIATLGVHKLSVSLADAVLDFFVVLDRADETYNLANNNGREVSKKRGSAEISTSPSSSVHQMVQRNDHHSHVGISTEEEYSHIVMSVAIGLKGLSTLLLYGNIHSEERVKDVVEMILERTRDLAEEASVPHDTQCFGYMTSCAFHGVRRIMELNMLPASRVSEEVLNILVRGADYEQNVYGKSRSAARLAMAELIIKTGHFPVERRDELLRILATKKEKGFSDHNLKPTPKEHLVSVAIDILGSSS